MSKPRKYRCKTRLVVPTRDEFCDVSGSHVAHVLDVGDSYYDVCYIIEIGDTFSGSTTPYSAEYRYVKLESTDNTFGFYLWKGTLDEYFEEVPE
jgi:hypothetical protein